MTDMKLSAYLQVIAENLCDVKSKLDGLESAYHDMMMRVHRLQSNRVCLGLLTGCDYPGERHPDNCPCADQRVKEEKVRAGGRERQKMNHLFCSCTSSSRIDFNLNLKYITSRVHRLFRIFLKPNLKPENIHSNSSSNVVVTRIK